jgi:hypothetical protein
LTWNEPLEQAIAGVAQPVNQQDMEALRIEVERIAASRVLAGLPRNRLAAGSLSELVHVNRVEGLALGFGGVIGLRGSRAAVKPYLAYGTSDHRITASVSATWATGATELNLTAFRRVRDISDLPVISPLLNSILAQEGGKDYGDYVLLHSAGLGVRHRSSGRTSLTLDVAVEESHSVGTSASPATGSYQPNPALGSGTYRVARVGLERGSGGIATRHDLEGRISLEGGEGSADYARFTATGRWSLEVGRSELLGRAFLGVGTDALPPHRGFVMGGRGTLVGEPYRAYGGRSAALSHLEWRFEVPAPALSLGSFASTGRRMVVAPFVTLGYADRSIAGLPWTETDGVRPVAGLAIELLMRLIRLELGVGLRDGEVGFTLDVNRDWWGLL